MVIVYDFIDVKYCIYVWFFGEFIEDGYFGEFVIGFMNFVIFGWKKGLIG